MAGMLDRNAVVVNKTRDGVDINKIWDTAAQAAELYNSHKRTIVNAVSFKTVEAAVPIVQSPVAEEFEMASEYGVAGAISPPLPYLKAGATLRDWDKRSAFSWRFIRDAVAEQVEAQIVRLFEADARLVQRLIFSRMLSPTPDINEFQHSCYGAWSGDGLIPPRYYGKSFDGSHSHYVVSGSEELDSEDIELAINMIREHGYGTTPGSRILVLCGTSTAEEIATWKSSTVSASAKVAKYSFIPSSVVPPFLTTETLVGEAPPADLDGVEVLGSYGRALIIETPLIPESHVLLTVTYGSNSEDNVLALREHPFAEHQGLRFLPGIFSGYPLIDTMATRAAGTGARHRAGWVALQLRASGSYEHPVLNL